MIGVRTKILIACAIAPAVLIMAAAISVAILRVAHYYVTNVHFHFNVAPMLGLLVTWALVCIGAAASFYCDTRRNTQNS